MVGKPEVALAADLFRARVVSALHLSSEYQKLIHSFQTNPKKDTLSVEHTSAVKLGSRS
jgi:hypothetical protein